MAQEGYTVDVNIVDYSKTGLKSESLKLYWRKAGSNGWNQVPLEKTPTHEVYQGVIPGMESGATIEYYAEAEDNSRRKETLPRVAPKGVYTFTII